jgi:post-segregation antitoxin (ccd killing protein)
MDRPGGRSDSEQTGVDDGPVSRVLRDQPLSDPDRDTRWAAWQQENAGAIDAWNAYVEQHGLPLSGFSQP